MAIQFFSNKALKIGAEGCLSNKVLKLDGYCDSCDELVSDVFLKRSLAIESGQAGRCLL